jgi:2,3-bisphosphoglycerate-dependent phosphoglycerate mutase
MIKIKSIQEDGVYSETGEFLEWNGLVQEENVVLFLIRHAEKKYSGFDPELTEIGKLRANKLVLIFEKFNLNGLYHSGYRRTAETVTPLADSKSIPPLPYSVRSQDYFIDELCQKSGRYLICGHVNTIPRLLNHFKPGFFSGNIDENEFGLIFMLVINKNQEIRVLEMRY